MRRCYGNKWLATIAALCAVGIASGAFAQRNDKNPSRDTPPTKEQAQDPTAPAGQPGAAFLDQMAAEGMMQMSQSEIQLANFALQHTKNEEVRSFAAMLIKDHVNLDKQLEPFVSEDVRARWGSESRAPAGEPGAPHSGAKAPERGDETAGQPATPPATESESGSKPASLFQIHQDMSDQLVSSIERELAQYQGNDFDRAFVGQQYWGHVVFIASATAGGKHVSGDLKQVVDQGAKTAEKHLEDCRKLIRELSANVARSPVTTPRR